MMLGTKVPFAPKYNIAVFSCNSQSIKKDLRITPKVLQLLIHPYLENRTQNLVSKHLSYPFQRTLTIVPLDKPATY